MFIFGTCKSARRFPLWAHTLLPRSAASLVREPCVESLSPHCLEDMKTWAQFDGGHGERIPHTFSDGGDIICHVPPLLLFRFCIWRGFKNKVMLVTLCEELFMLDGRPHIGRLMLKQSLVWYHWFCYFTNFSFNKIIFSIFQVSRDHERCLTASVQDFTLCGILLGYFLGTVRVSQLHMWETTVQPWFVPCRNVTGFAVTLLVVTYSETDSV